MLPLHSRGIRARLCIEQLEDRTTPNAGIGTFALDTATWSLRATASPGTSDVGVFQFGLSAKTTVPVVGDWNGDEIDGIGTYLASTATWVLRNSPSAGTADVGTFKAGTVGALPVVGDFTNPAAAQNTILTLTVKPLDIDLLGLKVQSSPITVTV